MQLFQTLGIEKGVTALIGSGGKTTMLHLLAAELRGQGTVLLTTSTHIRPSAVFPCLFSPTEDEVRAALRRSPVLCLGSPAPEGKLAACAVPFAALEALADYVLVEADGSRGLPLKAHAAHEPVIPENCRKTVCLVGAAGLGKPIREAVHRPELFCAVSGASPDGTASPEAVARVLNREALSDLYFINQCDVPEAAAQAEVLAALLERPAVCGSLRRDCAALPETPTVCGSLRRDDAARADGPAAKEVPGLDE